MPKGLTSTVSLVIVILSCLSLRLQKDGVLEDEDPLVLGTGH